MERDKRHDPRSGTIRPAPVPDWVPEPLARIDTITTLVGSVLAVDAN